MKVVNNTSTPYEHIRVENPSNEFDYPISIPANSTTSVDYFFTMDNAQVSVGTVADFYTHTFTRDVDFTIAPAVNQVVTVTIK